MKTSGLIAAACLLCVGVVAFPGRATQAAGSPATHAEAGIVPHLDNGEYASAAMRAALQPEFVLDRLKLFAGAVPLDALRMQANETWTPAARPAEASTDRSRIFYYRSVELETPLTENGRPVSARQQASAERAILRAEDGINQDWRGSESAGRLIQIDGQIVDIGSILRDFVWTPVGPARYGGWTCAQFHFAPRPGATVGSRAGRIMAAMEGDLWLSPGTGQILRVTFHNRTPVRFGLGLLASFSYIEGEFDMQPVAGGWVWGRTVVHLHGRELWWDRSGTLVKRYTLGASPAPIH